MNVKLLFFKIAGASLMVLGGLQGCLKGEEAITTKIGLALPTGPTSWQRATLLNGANEATTVLKIPCYYGTAPDSNAQIELLKKMVNAECKAIVLDPQGLSEGYLDSLIGEGMPLFLFNTPKNVNYTALVRSDNQGAADQAAGFVQSAIGEGSGKIAIFKVNNTNFTARTQAFAAHFPGQCIEIEMGTVTRAAAKESLLKVVGGEGGSQIIAVYAPDDDLAHGALDAITDSLKSASTIKAIVGCGGSQSFLKAIISNTTSTALATTHYSPALIRKSVEMAYALVIKGESPALREIIEPSMLINSDNAAGYLEAPPIYYRGDTIVAKKVVPVAP